MARLRPLNFERGFRFGQAGRIYEPADSARTVNEFVRRSRYEPFDVGHVFKRHGTARNRAAQHVNQWKQLIAHAAESVPQRLKRRQRAGIGDTRLQMLRGRLTLLRLLPVVMRC